mmetsp:Transcript_12425/g.31512  ORF Transcript_12425/g.31512 Transcript_12425/m.31512 type:complete len:207 (-) Transcript_12425:253-873(-)
MKNGVHFCAKNEWCDVPARLGQLRWQANHVIPTNWCYFNGKGVLVVVCVVVVILGDQLLGSFVSYRKHLGQKVNKFHAMASVVEIKVQAVCFFLNSDDFLVGIVLQDQLFQVEERTLVIHLLSGLANCNPGMLCLRFLALGTHVCVDDIFDYKSLLQDSATIYLFLHCQLHFQAPAMGLCPHKASINQLHFVQTSQSLKAERQELA